MSDRTFDFDVAYDDAIIDSAANTFVRRLAKKYGWLLFAACIVNIVGFLLVLMLPGSSKPMVVALGLLAALGPLYFPWRYLRLPEALAAPMKQMLKPTAHISICPLSFTMSAKERSFTSPWADLKAILEYTDYFLLVVGPFAFTFIPKKDAPYEAQQLIREVAALPVQPNLSFEEGRRKSAAPLN